MTFLYPFSAHLLYMHYWAAIINSICTYKNKNQKILVISKFPPQSSSPLSTCQKITWVYLSFSNSSSCLQKYSCAFNKKVPVDFLVRCPIGTWTQKVNPTRHGTNSSYPPHLPPLNFTGNGVSRCKTHERACSDFPGAPLLILGWCNSVQTQAVSSSCKYSY